MNDARKAHLLAKLDALEARLDRVAARRRAQRSMDDRVDEIEARLYELLEASGKGHIADQPTGDTRTKADVFGLPDGGDA